MAAAHFSAVDTLSVPPTRPSAGKKWSEVCQGVQQPDGSVRTPALLKGGGCVASAASPPRLLRPASVGGLRRPSRSGSLRVPLGAAGGASSRGGSSRGCSSGKSSRSSSRDPARDGYSRDGHSRDGDISSRCSSGGWETSTNSSNPSRPHTPPDAAPSPCTSRGLLMPNPIRTNLLCLPALLDNSEPATEAGRAEGTSSAPCPPELPAACADESLAAIHARPGMPLTNDPLGRDGSRRPGARDVWSVEPLAKYLKGVAMQIDANLRNERLPTSERLDSYVSKLVSNSRRKLQHAPRKVRHVLQTMFSRRFQKFWNFTRNEKVRSTTPEELKWVLITLVEQLVSDFAVNPDALAQPKAAHCPEGCRQLPRPCDAWGG